MATLHTCKDALLPLLHIKEAFTVGEVHMELEPFADESIWIIHQILPEDREAVLSILFAYQKRAETEANKRASAAASEAPSGGRG